MIRLLAVLLLVPGLAWAQGNVTPGSPSSHLFANGNVSGNGADQTEDTLTNCQYTVPAGQLAAVGDVLDIYAAGALAGTTDSRKPRLYFGSAVIGNGVSAVATVVAWEMHAKIVKTGASAQSYVVLAGSSAQSNGAVIGNSSNTTTQTDTAPILIKVTGQDSTASTANAVTCQVLTVDYYH